MLKEGLNFEKMFEYVKLNDENNENFYLEVEWIPFLYERNIIPLPYHHQEDWFIQENLHNSFYHNLDLHNTFS